MTYQRPQFNLRMNDETRKKLEALATSNQWSMSEEIRALVLKEYERRTDTVRVPVVGKVNINNGKVFIDDHGAEYLNRVLILDENGAINTDRE